MATTPNAITTGLLIDLTSRVLRLLSSICDQLDPATVTALVEAGVARATGDGAVVFAGDNDLGLLAERIASSAASMPMQEGADIYAQATAGDEYLDAMLHDIAFRTGAVLAPRLSALREDVREDCQQLVLAITSALGVDGPLPAATVVRGFAWGKLADETYAHQVLLTCRDVANVFQSGGVQAYYATTIVNRLNDTTRAVRGVPLDVLAQVRAALGEAVDSDLGREFTQVVMSSAHYGRFIAEASYALSAQANAGAVVAIVDKASAFVDLINGLDGEVNVDAAANISTLKTALLLIHGAALVLRETAYPTSLLLSFTASYSSVSQVVANQPVYQRFLAAGHTAEELVAVASYLGARSLTAGPKGMSEAKLTELIPQAMAAAAQASAAAVQAEEDAQRERLKAAITQTLSVYNQGFASPGFADRQAQDSAHTQLLNAALVTALRPDTALYDVVTAYLVGLRNGRLLSALYTALTEAFAREVNGLADGATVDETLKQRAISGAVAEVYCAVMLRLYGKAA